MKKQIQLSILFLVLVFVAFTLIILNPKSTGEIIYQENIFAEKKLPVHNIDFTPTENDEEEITINKEYEDFIIYNDQERFGQAFLVYEASLNDPLVENESPLIFLKRLDNETLQELKSLFYEKGTNILVGLTEDTETLTIIRRETDISAMIKFDRGARLTGESVSK